MIKDGDLRTHELRNCILYAVCLKVHQNVQFCWKCYCSLIRVLKVRTEELMMIVRKVGLPVLITLPVWNLGGALVRNPFRYTMQFNPQYYTDCKPLLWIQADFVRFIKLQSMSSKEFFCTISNWDKYFPEVKYLPTLLSQALLFSITYRYFRWAFG